MVRRRVAAGPDAVSAPAGVPRAPPATRRRSDGMSTMARATISPATPRVKRVSHPTNGKRPKLVPRPVPADRRETPPNHPRTRTTADKMAMRPAILDHGRPGRTAACSGGVRSVASSRGDGESGALTTAPACSRRRAASRCVASLRAWRGAVPHAGRRCACRRGTRGPTPAPAVARARARVRHVP